MSQTDETKTAETPGPADTASQPQPETVVGERGQGVTDVSDDKGGNNTIGRAAVLVLLILGGLGFLWLTWDRGNGSDEEQVTRTRIGPAVPFTPTTITPPEEPVQPLDFTEPTPQPQQQPTAIPAIDEDLDATFGAPVIAFSSNPQQQQRGGQGGGQGQGQGQGGGQDFSVDLPPELAGLIGGGGQQDLSRLRDRLETTPLEGVRASVIPDLHMVVPQGTSIPCVLQTAMSSDVPGMVSCTVQRDVLSASGQVVLMERGTVIVGEYEANLQRGQKRIFVLWNRARTPTGVIVNMASTATDGLGRAGFDGRIDNKFWERFGGAILMSIVGDASAYAFDQLDGGGGRGGGGFQTNETERATRDAASIALENSINIRPTLYKNQGEQVAIFVARDLDFGDVYDLRAIETRNQIFDRTISGNNFSQPMITK
ncbi:type IV secretion system protein VirB10 [Aureimonas altamirensis]|uniref:type IV secretion system protein VirB10 n=1 Tax=Aureimonas altamirensis TaxID=370622 RepID=UPI00203695C0|nr:type IV secretion system protein VirB10 [Aureimonas altamirensis]MCM2505653.1 type IV secretion system protein VirB10 [Aureimonas altamirensis]